MPFYSNYIQKRRLLLEGSLSLKDNVSEFINRIKEDSDINAFNCVLEQSAFQQADRIQNKLNSGSAGKLAGMVIAVKDVLSIKNTFTTCSSKILNNFKSIYTATAIQKLLDEDAIIIGKTNCDEFAMGSSNENSAFGAVLNPHDKTRVPGGSSGGSAAALAANLCDASIGTDTGGSIRQPAAFCGIYGLKPSFGRVSRFGLTAFASSFDCIGPFAKNISDLSLICEVISGKDEKDSTSVSLPPINFSNEITKNKITFGIAKEYFAEGLNREIKQAIEKVISDLKDSNIEIKEVSLPHTEYTIATYYILTTAEASSNLARFDGVKYGFRAKNSSDLKDMYFNTRSEGFGKEVKRRIMLGTYVLSAGYYDAYYKKAQKVRRLIQEDFQNAFGKVDVLIAPTTPTTAFKLNEKSSDPLEMYLNDIYTTSANLAGIPALNIPIGKDSNNLPIGMQLLSNQFEEEKLIAAAKIIEKTLN